MRRRYRKAAEIIKNQGKMSCLIVNDIDGGAYHVLTIARVFTPHLGCLM